MLAREHLMKRRPLPLSMSFNIEESQEKHREVRRQESATLRSLYNLVLDSSRH